MLKDHRRLRRWAIKCQLKVSADTRKMMHKGKEITTAYREMVRAELTMTIDGLFERSTKT